MFDDVRIHGSEITQHTYALRNVLFAHTVGICVIFGNWAKWWSKEAPAA
jgi:hypothetical protein